MTPIPSKDMRMCLNTAPGPISASAIRPNTTGKPPFVFAHELAHVIAIYRTGNSEHNHAHCMSAGRILSNVFRRRRSRNIGPGADPRLLRDWRDYRAVYRRLLTNAYDVLPSGAKGIADGKSCPGSRTLIRQVGASQATRYCHRTLAFTVRLSFRRPRLNAAQDPFDPVAMSAAVPYSP